MFVVGKSAMLVKLETYDSRDIGLKVGSDIGSRYRCSVVKDINYEVNLILNDSD